MDKQELAGLQNFCSIQDKILYSFYNYSNMEKKTLKNGEGIVLPPPANEEDVLVAQVYKTTHYEKFKFLEQNRKTDHVNALINSFQKRDVPNAILCNEKYEIIDGQNRFEARKALGLPVYYYCISDLDIYDVVFLNSFGKNWSTSDFVSMWASLGKENYRIIQTFKEEFPDFSLNVILMILSGSTWTQRTYAGSDEFVKRNGRISHTTNNLKEGLFEIKDLELSRYIARSIMQYKPYCRPGVQIYKQYAFVSAMTQLLRNKNFDNAEMVRRAEMFPTYFYRCVSAKEYIVMFEDLWNYRRKKKIHFEY